MIQVSRKGLFGVPYVIINNNMPTYVVKNKKTEEEKEIFCSYEKRNEWLKENPDWIGVIGSPSTISQHGSTLGRTSSDWQNLLSSIKKGSGGNNESAVKHGFSKKIQYTINNIGGEVVKDNETYLLKDNKTLNNLVVSSTLLNPFKQTTGHNHSGQEEVYIFVSGSGYMIVDDDSFTVGADDVVLIPDGSFHRVYNDTAEPLYFVCIFDGKRNH